MFFNDLSKIIQERSYDSPSYSSDVFSSVFDTFTEHDAQDFLSFALACGPHPQLKSELFGNTPCPVPGCACGNDVPHKFATGRKCQDGSVTGETLDTLRHSLSTLWEDHHGRHAGTYEEGHEDDSGQLMITGNPWATTRMENFCHAKEKMDAAEGLIKEQADVATFQEMMVYEEYFILKILLATDADIKVTTHFLCQTLTLLYVC